MSRTRGIWIAVGFVFAIALVARLAFIHVSPRVIIGDANFYDLCATWISEGRGSIEADGSPANNWVPGPLRGGSGV